MSVIQEFTKEVFLSMVPYLSLGIVLVMLEFFFDALYLFIDSLLSNPIKRIMQRNMRKIAHVMPNLDSFITFLITLLLIVPFLAVLINDIFTPFLRSLSNNFWIMLASPIVILIIVYFTFEKWYKRRFKRYA